MKALLKKDIFVLLQQMRLILLAMVLFAVIPNTLMNSLAVVYGALLTYTAMAYDERSKWHDLAAMMPYTTRDVVLSKYALSWLGIGITGLLNLAVAPLLKNLLGGGAGYTPMGTVNAVCVALLLVSVILPPMFRFGVEKGRMFYTILIVVCAMGSASVFQELDSLAGPGSGLMDFLLFPGLPLAALAATAVSVPLSVNLYQKRTA